MTIQDLLVKEGRWPTTQGPTGSVIKKAPAWITFRIPFGETTTVEVPGKLIINYGPRISPDISGPAVDKRGVKI